MRLSMPTHAFMRVPRALLAVPGRRGQYGNTAPKGRVPRAESGRRRSPALPGGSPAPARGAHDSQVVLAVDGGNSKTYLALLRADGTLLALVRGTLSSPITSASMARWRCSRGCSPTRRARRAFLGGTSRTSASSSSPRGLPAEDVEIAAALKARRWAARTIVGNDTFAVLRAGTERGWGVAVVCGAGINALAWRRTGRKGGRRGFRRSARSPVIGAVATTSVSPRSALRPGAKTDAAPAPRSSRQSRATSACGRRPGARRGDPPPQHSDARRNRARAGGLRRGGR